RCRPTLRGEGVRSGLGYALLVSVRRASGGCTVVGPPVPKGGRSLMTASSTADPRRERTAPSHVHDSLIWRRSTFSGGTNCVDVATAEGAVYIRDSQAAGNGQVLTISLPSWQAFLNSIRAGEPDL